MCCEWQSAPPAGAAATSIFDSPTAAPEPKGPEYRYRQAFGAASPRQPDAVSRPAPCDRSLPPGSSLRHEPARRLLRPLVILPEPGESLPQIPQRCEAPLPLDPPLRRCGVVCGSINGPATQEQLVDAPALRSEPPPHDDGPRLWLIAIALPWILLVHVSTGGIPRCAKHRVVGTLAKLPVALSVWLLLAVTAFVK